MDRVCHFEIPFSDKSRAADFYKTVFGWQLSEAPGEMPYTFVITTPVDDQMLPEKAGGINGGMYPRGDDGGSSSPVVVIEVPSCEQRLGEVVAAGGERVTEPTEIPNMGIYAQVKDPEGNILGLWQPLHPAS
jgi:predicted enzyme related to lactoylglutathione lyase